MSSQSFILPNAAAIRPLVAYLERRLEAGRPLRVTVGSRPSRTRDQNAYLHLAIRQLAEHVGMAETELKEFLKAEYGPEDVLRVGKQVAVVKKSTAKYTADEAAKMIDHVTRIAADCGLLIAPQGSP